MKGRKEVIEEFNDVVNMTASELETWLKSDDSNSAGWPKGDGEDGESVGHDSGRKIVDILKGNPKKEQNKYTDDQVDHMRRVVAYCKRHLAQEEKTNNAKSAKEVKKTKSYASLKNWGHDPLKKRNAQNGAKNGSKDKEEVEEEEQVEEEDDKEEDEEGQEEEEVGEEEDDEEDEEQTGDKRKAGNTQKGQTKKRATNSGGAKKTTGSKKNGEGNDEEEEKAEEENDDQSGASAKPKKGPKPGDTVSWNWGSGQPKGKVLDVKADKATITTKRGNEVSKDGDPENPAVILDAGSSKAIKKNNELNGTS